MLLAHARVLLQCAVCQPRLLHAVHCVQHHSEVSKQTTCQKKSEGTEWRGHTASRGEVIRNRPPHVSLVLCLFLSLLFLFLSFLPFSYLTSLLPAGLGNISLSVCYSTVVSVVMFAPVVVHRLGEQLCMVIGASGYCIFMASLISLQPAVVILCSVILGCSASILWVASGSYLSKCSEEHERGLNNGIFWSIFQSSTIIGNLSAFFIFQHVSSTQLFTIFCMVGCLGASMLLCLKPMATRVSSQPDRPDALARHADGASTDDHTIDGIDAPHSSALSDDQQPLLADRSDVVGVDSSIVNRPASIRPPDSTVCLSLPLHAASSPIPTPPPNAQPTVRASVREVWALFATRPIQLLIPMYFFIGMEIAFWMGEFPQMLPKESIGSVLCVAGLFEVVGGVSLGWLSDRFGKSVTLLLGSFVYAAGLLTVNSHLRFASPAGSIQPAWSDVSLAAHAAAACFGAADAAFNTQVYATIGERYAKTGKVTNAFTTLSFVQNIGQQATHTRVCARAAVRMRAACIQLNLVLIHSSSLPLCLFHFV